MFKTVEELESYLQKEYEGVPVVYFTDPYFLSAIVEVKDSIDGVHVVYDYDLMIESAMEEQHWTYEEAVDWIEYNTLRSLPYVKEHSLGLCMVHKRVIIQSN